VSANEITWNEAFAGEDTSSKTVPIFGKPRKQAAFDSVFTREEDKVYISDLVYSAPVELLDEDERDLKVSLSPLYDGSSQVLKIENLQFSAKNAAGQRTWKVRTRSYRVKCNPVAQ
jgi:hypothetical protein